MSIDKRIFANQMALVGDRIGRQLHAATLGEYYRHLTAALTTEQFVAATTIVFHAKSADYRNWPSPAEIIELVAPVAKPSLSALEAFERVLTLTSNQYGDRHQQLADVQAIGAAAIRAFRAAGGFRDFSSVLTSELPFLRNRFVEAYENACLYANAEQVATLALNDAGSRIAALVDGVARARSLPDPARRTVRNPELPNTPHT